MIIGLAFSYSTFKVYWGTAGVVTFWALMVIIALVVVVKIVKFVL